MNKFRTLLGLSPTASEMSRQRSFLLHVSRLHLQGSCVCMSPDQDLFCAQELTIVHRVQDPISFFPLQRGPKI